MASYAMGITELDPLEHGLIFERFLNPERVSWPDVDVDFDERRRGEVIRYVTDKYGEDRVAQIVTYGTIKAKQALKDASRVLGFPFAMGEKLTKAMPPAVMGKDITLSGIYNPQDPRYAEADEFRQVVQADPEAQRVLETAKGLENLKRQWGVHAAGVIMSSEPLVDIVPIMRRPQDGAIITQFDQPGSEALGLIKMDFLGLRNLTILDDALENIEMNGKPAIKIEEVPLDDPATYELLGRGDTLGVFQLDGGPMRSLLRQMRPDNFEDISAVIALYRPGPMGMNSHINYALRKNGLQKVEPIHPELEAPLEEVVGITHGLIVYQEQVQRAAQKLAGYTLGQADLLRRAMGKKKKEVLDKEFVPFQAGMRERGYSDASIQAVWDVLVPFAGYAFNKAHSAAYGVISYWTAYLKANYPTEYMAGLLTSVRDDKDKSALYLGECRHMGITVLAPDVNSSSANFTAVGKDIRFGLTAIRNVGANVVDAIVRAREEKGAFTSFTDFLDKVPAVVCNKRTIESLIKAGAFDSLGHARRALLLVHEQAVDSVIGVKRKEAEGQFDLFADLHGWRRRRAGLRGRRAGPAGLGQEAAAGVRAGDARPVRLGPPAVGARARARRRGGRVDRHAAAGRAAAGRLDGGHRRAHHVAAAQDVEAGQPVGRGHDRGHGGLGRDHVLRRDLPGVLHGAGRGRGRGDPRPGAAARRDHAAAGHGGVAAGRVAGGGRAGRGLDGGLPVHAAGGRAAP